jgi:acyl-CoA synthetase (AMP-forming)/AMP-acid ligase II
MDAEDPLFILYTSGSTGKPKGVLHTTGGYLLHAALTHKYVFDYHDGDIYWCTADVGWVTGHSYIVYGPLANGATTLMFEGIPTYPNAVAFLGGHRQAPGQHLLHRADRHPCADARGRRPGQGDLARRCACWVPWASRSTRKPGSGITTSATAAARSSTPGGRRKPAAS